MLYPESINHEIKEERKISIKNKSMLKHEFYIYLKASQYDLRYPGINLTKRKGLTGYG